jgi:hypothetical protein
MGDSKVNRKRRIALKPEVLEGKRLDTTKEKD